MSQVRTADRVHSNEIAIQEIQTTSSSVKDHSLNRDFGLHQAFDQDTVQNAENDFPNQAMGLDALNPSLLERFFSWFKKPDAKPVTATDASQKLEESTENKLNPIHPIPALESPRHIPDDLKKAKFSADSKKIGDKTQLNSETMNEALSMMSAQSIESIMFIIFKTQIQLEKENANVAEGTFSKYLDFQKMQQKVLCEIKDVLVSDENIVKHFGTAHNIALGANFLASIVAAAVSCGYTHPLLNILTSSPLAAGALMGLNLVTSGGKAYLQRRMDEHKAEHEGYSHKDHYYNERADDARNRLMTTAEADTVFKERWIHLLRRSDKMRKLVLKK